MKKYILAHDLGTSCNKAVLFSLDEGIVASAVSEYPLYTEHPGYAEQDALDWWRAVCDTTREVLSARSPSEIAAVTFSGQMMGALPLDAEGNPIRRAMIWADMRASVEENELAAMISRNDYYAITGQRMNSTYSAFKFMWMKKHEPEIYAKTRKLLCAKDYAIYRLTGRIATDRSDASGYGLLDNTSFEWSDKLCKLCDIDPDILPEICLSTDVAGTVTAEGAEATGLDVGTPVVFGSGDGPAAAVGSACIKEGRAYACMGTSSWISIATPVQLIDPKMRTVSFPHAVPGYYMPCGAMQCGGGSLAWAARELCSPEREVATARGTGKYNVIGELAASAPVGANGLVYLPQLLGERAPYWDEKSRGAFIGLTYAHTRADIIRSVMEGVSAHLGIILDVYREGGFDPDSITMIGGGARSRLWRQISADIYGIPVRGMRYSDEAGAVGVSIMAGVGIGLYPDFDVVDRFADDTEVLPNPENREVYEMLKVNALESHNALSGVFARLADYSMKKR